MVPIVYALSRGYLDFNDSLDFFPMLLPKPCSGDFKSDIYFWNIISLHRRIIPRIPSLVAIYFWI